MTDSTVSGLANSKTTIADHDLMYLDFDTSGTGAGPYTDEKIAGSDLKALMTAQATNASNLSTGTLPAGRLPTASTSAFGGVKDVAGVSHKFVSSVTSGVPALTQPAAADVSGLAASATTDATNAANISSGTLPDARLANVITAGGPIGDATHVAAVTWDAHGRFLSATSVAIIYPVSSVAGRGGAVSLGVADVSGAAPLASPTLTGTVTMPDGSTWSSSAVNVIVPMTITETVNGAFLGLTVSNPSTGSSAITSFRIANNAGHMDVGVVGSNWTPGTFNQNPNDAFFANTVGGINFAFPTGNGVEAHSDGQVVLSFGYTVATLPAGKLGARAYVTDASSPTWLGALTGGGLVKCPVFYNGSAWVAG